MCRRQLLILALVDFACLLDVSEAETGDKTITVTGRKLRTGGMVDEDRVINLSGLGKLVKLAGLESINVESLRAKAITDTAFALLKLDQAGDDVFKAPQFKTWVSYVTSVTKNDPTTTMLSTLMARYSDDVLIKMLEAAKKVEGTEDIAARLQRSQVEHWMESGKTADDIFELLDSGIENLLTNPNLATYVSYMNLFNKYSPGKETTLVNTFVTLHGDEAVAKVIEASKKVTSTEKFAKELQVALFSQWLREGAQPKQIWNMLHLNKATWKTDPNGEIWRGYREFYDLLS